MSQVASIIFLDSPVGTGFSYARGTHDYVLDDVFTADLVSQFIKKVKQFSLNILLCRLLQQYTCTWPFISSAVVNLSSSFPCQPTVHYGWFIFWRHCSHDRSQYLEWYLLLILWNIFHISDHWLSVQRNHSGYVMDMQVIGCGSGENIMLFLHYWMVIA